MSIERVKAYFASLGREADVQEFSVSSATVALAAQALGVAEAHRCQDAFTLQRRRLGSCGRRRCEGLIMQSLSNSSAARQNAQPGGCSG